MLTRWLPVAPDPPLSLNFQQKEGFCSLVSQRQLTELSVIGIVNPPKPKYSGRMGEKWLPKENQSSGFLFVWIFCLLKEKKNGS